MKPSDLSALSVLAALRWGGNCSADAEFISDRVMGFSACAMTDEARAELGAATSARPKADAGVAARAFTRSVEARTGAVIALWINEDDRRMEWTAGAVSADLFALAQLACPADEFAEFALGNVIDQYGLLGIRNGCVVWVLAGLSPRFGGRP